MSVLIQRVYKSRDNIVDLSFTYVNEDGTESALDLSPVNDWLIIVHGGATDATDLEILYSDGVTMTWDSVGNFTAALGDSLLAVGDFYVTMIVYDDGHPDGQVVISKEETRKLMFRVLDV